MMIRRFGFRQLADVRDHRYTMPMVLESTPKDQREVVAWEIGKILDQGNEGACFPPGTLIRMGNGSCKRIEDVRLLDQVLTAEGNVSTVTKLMVRMDAEQVVKLTVLGHRYLRATPEHPILTERGYIPVGELRIGDFIAFPKYMASGIEEIDTDELVPKYRSFVREDQHVRYAGVVGRASLSIRKTALPTKIKLTKAFGRLCGLFLAEGCASSNRVTFSFHIEERHTLAEEVIRIFKTELDVDASVQMKPLNKVCAVKVYGKSWAILFENLFSRGAKHKSIHPSLMSGPPEFQEAMLNGWLDGDGHDRRSSRQGTTISHQLAMSMYDIAQHLGLRPTISRCDPKPSGRVKSRQRRWDVTFADDPIRPSNKSKVDDKYIWRKFLGISLEPYEGPVYNMEVEGDHSYVAEGIGVHNCVGFGCRALLNASPFRQSEGPTAREIYLEARIGDEFDDIAVPSGTSVRAGLNVLKTHGLIESYVWATSIEDVLQFIAKKGPVVLGINWYGYSTAADGRIPMHGTRVGGHCVLGFSFDRKENVLGIQNSWGYSYGIQGCGYISLADLDREMRRGGVVAGVTERTIA